MRLIHWGNFQGYNIPFTHWPLTNVVTHLPQQCGIYPTTPRPTSFNAGFLAITLMLAGPPRKAKRTSPRLMRLRLSGYVTKWPRPSISMVNHYSSTSCRENFSKHGVKAELPTACRSVTAGRWLRRSPKTRPVQITGRQDKRVHVPLDLAPHEHARSHARRLQTGASQKSDP